MNLMQINEVSARCAGTAKNACRALRLRILEQINKTRASIVSEFEQQLQPYDQLLRLAITEAESLAWQTRYPHLLFPTLAREKAESVAAWKNRQQELLHSEAVTRLAA